MSIDDAERNTEKPRESQSSRPESVINEVNAGRADLVKAQKELDAQLKAGGPSGITSDFGRLIIDGLNRVSGAFRRTESNLAQHGSQAAEAVGGGLGRMVRDGWQAVSSAFRLGGESRSSDRSDVREQ